MGEAYIIRSGSSGSKKILPAFSYTGDYTILDDGDAGWRVKFLTSGVLTFDESVSVDVFCVGGGASGGTSGGSSYRGGGGGAGYTATQTGIFVEAGVEYSIVIGEGGASKSGSSQAAGNSGGETSAFNVVAAGGLKGSGTNAYSMGGNGGSGGAGGGSQSASGGVDGGNGQASSRNGTGQGTTTREFGESDGPLYATGGASGVTTANLFAADANTGDGGDGAYSQGVASGAGGSGVVVIRNARGVA